MGGRGGGWEINTREESERLSLERKTKQNHGGERGITENQNHRVLLLTLSSPAVLDAEERRARYFSSEMADAADFIMAGAWSVDDRMTQPTLSDRNRKSEKS